MGYVFLVKMAPSLTFYFLSFLAARAKEGWMMARSMALFRRLLNTMVLFCVVVSARGTRKTYLGMRTCLLGVSLLMPGSRCGAGNCVVDRGDSTCVGGGHTHGTVSRSGFLLAVTVIPPAKVSQRRCPELGR